jgi:phosphoenolpyruvate-protein phosphotransferase
MPTQLLRGRSISPGFAEGFIHVQRILSGPSGMPGDEETYCVEEEISRLDLATRSISDDLLALASRVAKEIDSKLAEVFNFHNIMVNDGALQEELKKEIAGNLVSAGSAVKKVFLRWENRFLLMESQIAKDKGDDMRDLSNRLCNALAGITIHPLEGIPPGCVLATTRLLPSDTVFLGSRSASAVLLEYGSTGSHAALFVRELGLPCISELANLVATVPEGAEILVDANEGIATIHPIHSGRIIFREKVRRSEQAFRKARVQAMMPALTRDGVTIPILANVGCRNDTKLAMENGADGVGLYRIEQAYLGRLKPPSAEELFDEMQQTLNPARGKSVCVRLLDIGADKPLPYLKFMAESNPSLGRRGVRLLREFPELLDTQLRTVLKLSKEFDIRLLVPMVTLPDDMLIVSERLSKLASEMLVTSVPKLGAMIETPAAVFSACKIAAHSDFLSCGTNDLTQYTFAADRENAAVERYYQDSSEAIFRLIKIIHDDVAGFPLSLCGELAGRPDHTARLLGCGIKSFSVAPPLIPFIKKAIGASVINCESPPI